MKIMSGLFSHCVLQRNRRGVSDALIIAKGIKETPSVMVRRGRRKVSGITLTKVPVQKKDIPIPSSFKSALIAFRIKGIPAGGPYTLILENAGIKLTVEDVLVGDVWLLGGQSNMQGIGLYRDRAPSVPEVRAYYMNDRWGTARDPIHNRFEAKAPVHAALNGGVQPERNPYAGVGPGVAFGQEMYSLTGVPQGVIANAHGGTSMSQWSPKLKNNGDLSLYGAMLNRFRRNGSAVKGLVWYQGESDANQETVDKYTNRMKKLIRALRKDTGIADLPVAMVQIGRVLNWGLQGSLEWNRIQEQQRLLPGKIRRLTVVPAVNLELEDSIHISGRDQQRLGKHLARAMARLLGDRKAGLPPIELKKVHTEISRNDRSRIVVEFTNAEKRLTAKGRPHGFYLSDGLPSDEVVKVELKGKKAIVESVLPKVDLDELNINYGLGTNPYCNITDEGGRSLPAFGPLPLGQPRARTSYINCMRLSPGRQAEDIATLKYPGDLKQLEMKSHLFNTTFCDIREHAGSGDKLIWFACTFICKEPMKLHLMFGYDGPFKVWWNGKEVFCDPSGTNPALPTDKGTAQVTASAGTHEAVLALTTNKGAAWGIYFRVERQDVTKSQLRKGREAYILPEVKG